MSSRGLIVTLCDQQEPHPRTFLLSHPQVKMSIQAAVKFAFKKNLFSFVCPVQADIHIYIFFNEL